MATSLICGNGNITQNFGVTSFYSVGGAATTSTTESDSQATWRTAGVVSHLWYLVSANTVNATSTFRLRKNTANANSVVSVGSSTTGAFEDTVNTDSIAAGDILNFSLVTGGASGSIDGKLSAFLYNPNDGSTLFRSVASRVNGRTYSTASTTFLEYLEDGLSGDSALTDARTQVKWLLTATMKNLFVRVTTNGRGTISTVGSRIGGVAGNLIASIGAAATGIFEDTSHTDSITSGSLVNATVILGTGAGSLILTHIAFDFSTAGNQTQYFAGGGTGAIATSITCYSPIQGTINSQATESFFQLKSGVPATVSNMAVHVNTNTISAASTLKFRINGGNGNQSISITASTAGYFEDSSGTDSVVSTDLINLQMITGATGTSINLDSVGVLLTFAGGQTIDMWGLPTNQPVYDPIKIISN